MPFQEDYLERVYAGVLGKLIGVYLGGPFEGHCHGNFGQRLRSGDEAEEGDYATYWTHVSNRQRLKARASISR
jgi:hypothetical protein